jgi:hypothetical protein
MIKASALVLGGCYEWRYDVTEAGIAFSKVKLDENGLVIGELKQDTVIGGRPCKRGWVHILPSGVPVGFTASRDIDTGRCVIPADTWVFQDKDGVVEVCAFPRDTEVQGFLCHGSGGPKGVQAAFYPDGALKEFFLVRDTRIQDIPCRAGIFSESVQLHENGRIKKCVLSEDIERDGQTYPRGTRLRMDTDGRIIP